jgi:hypothetical protein
MIIPLRKADTISISRLSVPRTGGTDAASATGLANGRPTADASPDRRLRNRIILANALAWILIVAAIRLIFF